LLDPPPVVRNVCSKLRAVHRGTSLGPFVCGANNCVDFWSYEGTQGYPTATGTAAFYLELLSQGKEGAFKKHRYNTNFSPGGLNPAPRHLWLSASQGFLGAALKSVRGAVGQLRSETSVCIPSNKQTPQRPPRNAPKERHQHPFLSLGRLLVAPPEC
jgi:hypothetical protein